MKRHRFTLAPMLAPVLAAAAGLSLAASFAHGSVVNFDVFPGGGVVPNNTVIGSQYSSLGVLFSSTAPGGPTAGSFTGEASSAPNFLVGIAPGSGAGLFPIQMDFTVAGITSVSLNALSVGTGIFTATAYAADLSTVLDTVSFTNGPGAGNGFGNINAVTLNGAGIARVVTSIAQTQPIVDGFGLDDVSFVPSPGAAALLGLGGLMAMRRRRV